MVGAGATSSSSRPRSSSSTAVGVAVQLFIGKAVLDTVLGAGASVSFGELAPVLAALVAITVALDLCAGDPERSRAVCSASSLAEARLDRVLDVATRVDLLAFESPDFYDRLQRARAQGQYRALQTVNGLLGIVGASVAAVGLIVALAALQPLLLPFILVGYVPLWIVASLNTRDLYRFSREMTPHERQRNYLGNVLMSRNAAKEVPRLRSSGSPAPSLRPAVRRADLGAALSSRRRRHGAVAHRVARLVGRDRRDDRDALVALRDGANEPGRHGRSRSSASTSSPGGFAGCT